VTAATGVLPACPSWCKLPGGHPYDVRTADGAPIRFHEADVDAPYCAGIGAEEVLTASGALTVTAPYVYLDGEGVCLTAEQLQDLVVDLLRVAARLDLLNGAK
jgi:hypothetical protein